nr:MAG TPA: hypothetical protein [Caudoviricetes sp.]
MCVNILDIPNLTLSNCYTHKFGSEPQKQKMKKIKIFFTFFFPLIINHLQTTPRAWARSSFKKASKSGS